MWRAAVSHWRRRAQRLGWMPALLGLSAGMLLLAACQSVAPVVKVGLVAPFEGRDRALGYDVLYSARLAVREINAAGGIGGTRVALVALDDGGSAEFAVATAESLLIDPAVVAVVGHWLPPTTGVARPLYDAGGLLLLPGGEPPYTAADPALLSPEFVSAYTAVTPFDEVPGPYAGAAYEAFQQLWHVMEQAGQQYGRIDRAAVRASGAAAATGH